MEQKCLKITILEKQRDTVKVLAINKPIDFKKLFSSVCLYRV